MQAWLDGVLGLSNTRKRGSSPGSGQGASASGTGALQQALHTLDNNLVAACNARQLDLDFGLQDRWVVAGSVPGHLSTCLLVFRPAAAVSKYAEVSCLCHRATDAASGQSWAGSLPLQLMLGPSTQGSTDLQMQLFTLIAGSQAPAALAPGLRLSGLDQGEQCTLLLAAICPILLQASQRHGIYRLSADCLSSACSPDQTQSPCWQTCILPSCPADSKGL